MSFFFRYINLLKGKEVRTSKILTEWMLIAERHKPFNGVETSKTLAFIIIFLAKSTIQT